MTPEVEIALIASIPPTVAAIGAILVAVMAHINATTEIRLAREKIIELETKINSKR